MCAGVHGCARLLAVVGGSLWVCAGVHRCGRVCAGVHGCAQVCDVDMRGYVWICMIFRISSGE